ncbi:hypothetical protein HDA32_001768 [Spinactinospora alkalitolerans]|uniref:DUF4132 domain-containing protein n=1 Tax=Spinactinospora alkalitolerans TaxID=687207 RepID=A0A852TRR6_9ACTN|nr:DUF4132 domain-containing protein [Spinactinospora alkalitolerans]NYE46648.1 hypothetical protein [Spinactinospora alkalitolerans]
MSTTPTATAETVWTDGPDGYALALDGRTLVCRGAKGRRLKSVPKKVRDSAEAERLLGLAQWLQRHDRECRKRVESWMLGALPVPAALLAEVWPDPSWRALLENLFVVPAEGGDGGFLRGIGDDGRIDAETAWLGAERVVISHPVLIDDLDDVREFALELGIEQGVPQLTREVHRKPGGLAAEARRVADYADGEFEALREATGRAQRGGFAVRGGYAVCRAVDAGRSVQARYWIGSDAPEYRAFTGDLVWVDADERPLPLREVGPVAWSEGVRMAEMIYTGRTAAEEDQA